MDSHSLLQRIFPTQGLNSGLLHCRQILYQLSHQGRPGTHYSYSQIYKYYWIYYSRYTLSLKCHSDVKPHHFCTNLNVTKKINFLHHRPLPGLENTETLLAGNHVYTSLSPIRLMPLESSNFSDSIMLRNCSCLLIKLVTYSLYFREELNTFSCSHELKV